MELHQKVLAGVVSFLLLIVGFFAIFTCDYVEPGHVGIVVNLYGTDKGVDEIPVRTGYVWYCRWSHKVYEYPIFTQRTEFAGAEAISFSSNKGVRVGQNVGLHYTIVQSKAPDVFIRLRGDELAVRNYLFNRMRDAVTKVASTMPIEEIYGDGKVKLLTKAQEMLQNSLHDEINIELLTFTNAPELPQNVIDSINMTIQAQQNAIAAENKVAQSKAEADQKIEDARGRGESVLIEANKQAEANITLAKSLTPELVNWQAIQKWDGKLPTVTSGATPFIQVK